MKFPILLSLLMVTTSQLQAQSLGVGADDSKRERTIFEVAALKYVGTPYKFGGNDPRRGIDCSNFVSLIMKECNVSCPPPPSRSIETGGTIVHRNSSVTAAWRGGGITNLKDFSTNWGALKPGDVVVFQTKKSGQTEPSRSMGIFLGKDLEYKGKQVPMAFVRAVGGQGVVLQSLKTESIVKNYKYSIRLQANSHDIVHPESTRFETIQDMLNFGVEVASRKAQVPYKLGGNGLEKGVDSSNLVSILYNRLGPRFPPPVNSIIRISPPVSSMKNLGRMVHCNEFATRNWGDSKFKFDPEKTNWDLLKPGDVMVILRPPTKSRPVSNHCMIYLGKSFEWKGKTIAHAILHSKGGKGVTVDSALMYKNIYNYAIRLINDDGTLPLLPKRGM